MRDRIFSSVLLPAPLRPMMPTTSPRLTSKETSFSAQIVGLSWLPLPLEECCAAERRRRKGAATASVITSRIVL